jgi:type II restriction/modification system DNA methylase subunit YeeA
LPTSLTPQEFVSKWQYASAKERSAAQEHFIDLCRLIDHPTPMEADPAGAAFTFEAGAAKHGGGQGWADVWKKGRFAWEYKGQHANLDKAYDQLLQYREALQNPPLLIVSDMASIVIHTNFTDTVKHVITLTLDDLLQPAKLDVLRRAFTNPYTLRAKQTPEQVTQQAAAEFARLAEDLRKYRDAPSSDVIAHFLIRLLFCLFAEDVGLLPAHLFSRLIERTKGKSAAFRQQLQQLFAAMRGGGWFGVDEIHYFDGHLFDDDSALELDGTAMHTLARISHLDWSSIEPSVFGTLFERSLDPDKRSQLGAHYTSKEDILLIVEPVLMVPLRRRWAEVQAQAKALAQRRDAAETSRTRANRQQALINLLVGFSRELAGVRVLDAACGSGNFLYIALRLLLDLEKEVITLAGELGCSLFSPNVSPEQLHGIEINPYAYELAQVTIWIGYIQWMRDNGFGFPGEPILKPLDTIRHMDAILAYDAEGRPVEPEWPEAEVIIGNPPFLGGNKIRKELGDAYVEALFALYAGRVPAFADLVCYWFEKARALVEEGKVKRVGLLATNSIRGGASRKALERIKETGDIFWAQSDRDWVLEGAAVNVSMVGFDDGTECDKQLDDVSVKNITPDLQADIDLTKAVRLQENSNIAFIGDTKKGKFDISGSLAAQMLLAPLNPNGRPNSDVIKPWINGLDVTQRHRGMCIIDFGIDTPESEAALYELPFEYVRKHVKPERDEVRNPREKRLWWIHGRPAPDFRNAIEGLTRYIATARVAKYRLFVYVDIATLPDGQIVAFARQDDYFFGVLHSKPHELWALRQGTSLEDRPRYSQTFTFETFPFPWPPHAEPVADPRVEAIAQASRELVEKRDRWLNPGDVAEAELKKRTLTNLYNQRPTWLEMAHRKLDDAVLDAYGWPRDLSDADILERLLALNLERARDQAE